MWSEEKLKIARGCGEKYILKSKCYFFSSLAERAITAVPVTALQKEAIVTSSAMPRIHQAEYLLRL